MTSLILTAAILGFLVLVPWVANTCPGRYWRGRGRLRWWNLCPLCNSSPPRRTCPVCLGAYTYGPQLSPDLKETWRERLEDWRKEHCR